MFESKPIDTDAPLPTLLTTAAKSLSTTVLPRTCIIQGCSMAVIIAVSSRFRSQRCGFQGKAAGDSDPFQPLIPTQPSHRFRLKPATP
jgi:hypothetical protein